MKDKAKEPVLSQVNRDDCPLVGGNQCCADCSECQTWQWPCAQRSTDGR